MHKNAFQKVRFLEPQSCFLGQQHQRCREKPTALFNLQEIFKKEKTVDFFNKTCYNKVGQMKKIVVADDKMTFLHLNMKTGRDSE